MQPKDFAVRLWFALRKNLQLKRAHPWATVLEILLPSVFVTVLVIIRTMTQSEPVRCCGRSCVRLLTDWARCVRGVVCWIAYKPPNVAYNCGNVRVVSKRTVLCVW